jgi:perosamine synthetase
VDLIPIIKPWIGTEEAAAIEGVLESGWVAQGPKVAEFERAVASVVGAGEGVAVTSCTSGLHLTLHALGVRAGDEVVVPSLSFIASSNAPRYVGAKPVFADVDEATFNITPDSVRAVMTPRTRVVILVHQLGMPADIEGIQAVCDQAGVTVIEDAACAMGSTYHGSLIGGHSDLVVFSFHPRKLITTGEGGMVMARDGEFAERLRRLRQHAMSLAAFERHSSDDFPIDTYSELGFNFRMTELQAIIQRRRSYAERYNSLLSELEGVVTPGDPPYGTTNYQSYAVVLNDEVDVSRDDLMHRLGAKGIASRRGVMAAHLEPAFKDIDAGPLPVTEKITKLSLLLPLFHEMTLGQQDRVVETLASELG